MSDKLVSYCAKCGASMNGNNGWKCDGCLSWFCVGCRHGEDECLAVRALASPSGAGATGAIDLALVDEIGMTPAFRLTLQAARAELVELRAKAAILDAAVKDPWCSGWQSRYRALTAKEPGA